MLGNLIENLIGIINDPKGAISGKEQRVIQQIAENLSTAFDS
jgi:hypothetical protein